MHSDCFFCHGISHVSEFCNIYESNESRKEIFDTRNCCRHCLKPSPKNYKWCLECPAQYKCYLCFSKKHHPIWCKERFEALKWQILKIDKDLFSRFLQFLDTNEKYFLIASSLIAGNQKLSFTIINDENRYNFIRNLNQQIKSTIVIVKNSNIYASEFFHHLSFNDVKVLEFYNVTFHPLKTFTFTVILKELPFLEELKLFHCNEIEVKKSWVKGLQEYGKNLKKLTFIITSMDFDVKNLALFMKQQNIQIFLFIDLFPSSFDEACDLVNRKLMPKFSSFSVNNSTSILVVHIAEPSSSDKDNQSFNHFKNFYPI